MCPRAAAPPSGHGPLRHRLPDRGPRPSPPSAWPHVTAPCSGPRGGCRSTRRADATRRRPVARPRRDLHAAALRRRGQEARERAHRARAAQRRPAARGPRAGRPLPRRAARRAARGADRPADHQRHARRLRAAPGPRPAGAGRGRRRLAAVQRPDLGGWRVATEDTNAAALRQDLTAPDDAAETTGWSVENGMLVGRGPASHLFSPRGDFKNPRSAPACASRTSNPLYFRTAFAAGWPDGYEARSTATRRPAEDGSRPRARQRPRSRAGHVVRLPRPVRTRRRTHITISVNGIVITDRMLSVHPSAHRPRAQRRLGRRVPPARARGAPRLPATTQSPVGARAP